MTLSLAFRTAAFLVLFAHPAGAKRADIHATLEGNVEEAEQSRRNDQGRKTASLMLSHYRALGKALPPGFEEKLYCPQEYCIHNKPQPRGMSGPRSMFVECKHVAGEQEPLPVESWGTKKPAADRERLLQDGYHQDECPEHFQDEIPDIALLEVDDHSDDSAYTCGAVASASDACYPKEKDVWPNWFDKDPCSGQCESKWGLVCHCPNSGEHCTSALSNDPGLHTVNGKIAFTFISAHYAVKVNNKTKEWEFLASTHEWEGSNKVRKFFWQSPSAVGKSFMAQSVMTPSPSDIQIEGFNSKADFCNPKIAAQYMESFSALEGGEIDW